MVLEQHIWNLNVHPLPRTSQAENECAAGTSEWRSRPQPEATSQLTEWAFQKGARTLLNRFLKPLRPTYTWWDATSVSPRLLHRCGQLLPSSALERGHRKWRTQVSGTSHERKAASPLSAPTPFITRGCSRSEGSLPLVVCKGLLSAPLFDKILGTSQTRVCINDTHMGLLKNKHSLNPMELNSLTNELAGGIHLGYMIQFILWFLSKGWTDFDTYKNVVSITHSCTVWTRGRERL